MSQEAEGPHQSPRQARYQLAYLVSHPIQYQAPLLRRIAQEPSIDLTVLFLSDLSVRGYQDPGFGSHVRWDVPLLAGYKYEFLPALGRTDRLSPIRPLTRTVRQPLRNGAFDAVWVHGYAHQATLRAIVAARRLGIPILARGESHLGLRRWPAARKIREQLLPRLFAHFDAFLAIGSRNRAFYEHHGVPEHRIFDMPYAVDNGYFHEMAERAESSREDLRAELACRDGQLLLLFAGKLQPRKRVGDLIEALRLLEADERTRGRVHLAIVGDGTERTSLEARVEAYGLRRSVRFVGFKNQSELPAYYTACDVFALPSASEPWGLAVNEVMNTGKAVIVSDEVGAGPDLVRDGENGFIVPVGDVRTLASRLGRLALEPNLPDLMGRASLERIRHWSFEEDVEGLRQALATVCSAG